MNCLSSIPWPFIHAAGHELGIYFNLYKYTLVTNNWKSLNVVKSLKAFTGFGVHVHFYELILATSTLL